MSTVNVDEIRQHIQQAHDEICGLADGSREWRMRVPAQPERDGDLVIAAALADAETLIAEVERLRALLGDDPRHVIEFRETGWTIKHPLSCRPNLFECLVNRAAERDLVEAPGVLGRFECDISEGGGRFLIGDSVGGYDTSTVEDRRIQSDPPRRATGEDSTDG